MDSTTTRSGRWYRDNPTTWHPDPSEVSVWFQENPYTPTAGWHDLPVAVKRLRALPGKHGEHRIESGPSEQAITDRIANSLQRDGWWEGNAALICIEQDGLPYIYEGNHRIHAAELIGLTEVPCDVRYLGGSETIPNVWTPDGKPLPL